MKTSTLLVGGVVVVAAVGLGGIMYYLKKKDGGDGKLDPSKSCNPGKLLLEGVPVGTGSDVDKRPYVEIAKGTKIPVKKGAMAAIGQLTPIGCIVPPVGTETDPIPIKGVTYTGFPGASFFAAKNYEQAGVVGVGVMAAKGPITELENIFTDGLPSDGFFVFDETVRINI